MFINYKIYEYIYNCLTENSKIVNCVFESAKK